MRVYETAYSHPRRLLVDFSISQVGNRVASSSISSGGGSQLARSSAFPSLSSARRCCILRREDKSWSRVESGWSQAEIENLRSNGSSCLDFPLIPLQPEGASGRLVTAPQRSGSTHWRNLPGCCSLLSTSAENTGPCTCDFKWVFHKLACSTQLNRGSQLRR